MPSERTDPLEKMRSDARRLFAAGIRRVDPCEAVKRFMRIDDGELMLGTEDAPAAAVLPLHSFEHVYVIGGGKASAPMGRAVERLLGDRISGGLVVVKVGFSESLKTIEIMEADHPLPDGKGEEGARRILHILKSAEERDLIISLISGGGSALLPVPAGKITLSEKQAMTKMLLECGATIGEINAVRKHISASKGGQMARAAFPATTVNLMLSDVVGDKLDVIASGPFVPDPTTFQDAAAVLKKYKIRPIPRTVRNHLEKGARQELEETPKPGDPVFQKVHNFVIGSNRLALDAAEQEAKRLGYNTLVLSSMVEGETREVAHVHTAIAKEILAAAKPIPSPACVISGGETTVTIRGSGLGGRNQEFCLSAAIDLSDLPARVVVASGGTDGNDGPTDAAGGIVDGLTCQRGKEQGLSAGAFLDNNDAYRFLEKTGDLLVTGPTRTNVMDVHFVLVR